MKSDLRSIARSLALLPLVLCGGLSAHAAQSYDAIYVFGDSYCDTGNIFLATKGALPAAPYYDGRFSNGPLWVEHLAASFGRTVKPSLAGGSNYAFGGAELLEDLVTPEGTVPSVQAQVALYLAAHGGKADPNALYIIEGGGNDILDNPTADPAVLGSTIGATLAGIETALAAAGAKSFLVPNLFNVGLLPAGHATYAFDTAATNYANAALAEALAAAAVPGVSVYSPDTYALFNAIEKDSSHFGFSTTDDPCLNTTTGTLCSDPAHALFWDTEHPTTFGHAMLAVSAETLVHP